MVGELPMNYLLVSRPDLEDGNDARGKACKIAVRGISFIVIAGPNPDTNMRMAV